jgi:hypothetical protein
VEAVHDQRKPAPPEELAVDYLPAILEALEIPWATLLAQERRRPVEHRSSRSWQLR